MDKRVVLLKTDSGYRVKALYSRDESSLHVMSHFHLFHAFLFSEYFAHIEPAWNYAINLSYDVGGEVITYSVKESWLEIVKITACALSYVSDEYYQTIDMARQMERLMT